MDVNDDGSASKKQRVCEKPIPDHSMRMAASPSHDIPITIAPVTGMVSDMPLYTCDLCTPPKNFNAAWILRKHQRVHQLPCRCSHPGCDGRFAGRKDLERHEWVYHAKGNNPSFQPRCSYPGCDYATFRRDNLARHQRMIHGHQVSEPLNASEERLPEIRVGESTKRPSVSALNSSSSYPTMTSESLLKIINRSLPYKNGIPKPEDGAKEPNNSSGSIDALPSRTMPLFAVSQESESANLQVNIDKPQELVHINSTTESEWTSNTRSTFDASTDSGYGSIPPQRLKKSIHAALKRPSVGNPAGGNQLGGSHGISTTYSDAQCIQDDDCRTRYLTEIYEELSGMFPESLPSAELPRLESTLPVLLKAFAVKLGFSDTSPDHRTVAYLVHSHYDQITEALLHVSIEDETNEDESTLLPINSRMSLKDKMSMWDEKEGADDLVPRSMSPPSVCDGEVLAEYDTNGEKEKSELCRYLVNSPAYSWLASSLAAELQHETLGEDVRGVIRQQILNTLKIAGEDALKEEVTPSAVEMVFDIPWHLEEFFDCQDYPIPPEEALPRVIVLTGTGNNIQASTASDYLFEVWPFFGPEMLKLFQDLLSGSQYRQKPRTLLDGTWVSGFMTADEIKITVSGTTCSIAEIGEILAWMRTALSGGFSHLDRVWTGTPVLQASNSSMKVLSRLDPGEVPLVPHSSQPGSCWYNILGNVVSVKGYPTKRRPEHHTGIELPLPMMIPLANARRLSRFKGMLCIKGYCSIVVPTRRQGGFIYWHLITNSDGEHISYTDGRVVTLAETYPQDLSIEDLRTSRHILGWTPQVENLTGSSDARYGIRWSGLSRPRPGCAFEKVSITGGSFVTAGVSAILGKKDKSVQMQSRDDYIMRLKWISKKFVVLYDVHERRAWLVDGASALLHLVRASLKHDASDFFKDLLLSNSSSLQESPEPFTGKPAAIRILTNKANLSLPLYAKPAESKIEETTTDIGTQNKILSTTTHYTFKDRVEDIYERLEQIIAHQADVSSEDGIGFRISLTLRRQLEGFDFMDVATDEDPIWPRVTTVRARGRGWIDLTRALHSITLFGTGFGELFRPTQRSGNCSNCLANSEVPKGEDYLAVCTRELREILEKRGSKETNPWKLIDDIYWHTPDMSFEPCRCKKFSVRKHDRIQVLLPSSLPKFWGRGFKSPVHLAPQGAVLFGHSWRFPLRWKDGGLPEEGEPDDELEDMEACFQDSGLGTSPESSSATADEPSQSGSHIDPLERRLNISRGMETSDRPLKRPGSTLPCDIAITGDFVEQEMLGRPTKRYKVTPGDTEDIKNACSAETPLFQANESTSSFRSRIQHHVTPENDRHPPSNSSSTQTRSHSPSFFDPWRKWKGKGKAT